MPIDPTRLVRDIRGRPQPPPDLLARLQRFDARIGLFYLKSSWAIIDRWAENDPRRARVQSGDTPEENAFDIIGHLPITCSLDEAPAYIERELRGWRPDQFRALRDAVHEWNTADGVGQDALMEEALLTEVERDLTKSGPSLGIVNVPVQLTDNTDDEQPIEHVQAPEPPAEAPAEAPEEEKPTPKPRRRPMRKRKGSS